MEVVKESMRRKNEECDRLKSSNDPNNKILATGIAYGFDNYEYLNVRSGERFLLREKNPKEAWKEYYEFKSTFMYKNNKAA